jgi:hypothetical protein
MVVRDIFGVGICRDCEDFINRMAKTTEICVQGLGRCRVTVQTRHECYFCRYMECIASGLPIQKRDNFQLVLGQPIPGMGAANMGMDLSGSLGGGKRSRSRSESGSVDRKWGRHSSSRYPDYYESGSKNRDSGRGRSRDRSQDSWHSGDRSHGSGRKKGKHRNRSGSHSSHF